MIIINALACVSLAEKELLSWTDTNTQHTNTQTASLAQ